ncbi:MAG: hypothetical protein M3R04_06505, partial [bacterium]|nr:hypothetical protein [bacterium]
LVFSRTQSSPTGDPLLDFYLSRANGGFSSQEREELKRKFADDPRAGDLIFFETTAANFWVPGGSGSPEAFDKHFKEHSADGSKVSPAMLRAYIDFWENQWAEEAPDVPYTGPDHKTLTNAQRVKYRTEHTERTSAWIDVHHKKERNEAFARLEQLAPDASITWYHKAMLTQGRGEYEKAIECLRRGNAAPHNRILAPYPLLEYTHAARNNTALLRHPRIPIVSRMLLTHSVPSYMIQYKDMFFCLSAEAVTKGDTGAMNDLHQFACRYATMEDCGTLNALVALILLKDAAKKIDLKPLTAQQRKHVGELLAKLDKLKVDLKAQVGNYPSSLAQANPSWFDTVREKLGREADISYTLMHKDFVWEQQQFAQNYRPQFEAISKFDFNTYTWEQAK